MELDIYTATLDEIVFEDRNKAYGGYFLRVWYDKNVTKATIIACSLFIFLSSGIFLYYKATLKAAEVVVPVKIEMEVTDEPLKEEEMKKLPPPPPKVEQPKIETMKFLPPVIKPDNKVVKEEQLKEMDSLLTSNIDTKSQEGEKDLELQDFEGEENGVVGGTGVKEVQVFNFASEMPKFKGAVTAEESNKAFGNFVRNNIVYPSDALAKGITGTVYVMFVISSTGEITNVEIIKGRGLSPSMDAEAIRVIKKTKWSPAKNNGTPVNLKMTLPIKFQLN